MTMPPKFYCSLCCIAVATAIASSPTLVFAQSATAVGKTPSESELQDLLRQGIAAYRKGDYQEARTALLQAIAIKPSLSFVAMLADSEMRLKRYRDAAEHWSLYLSLLAPEQENERSEATAQLEVCRAHVGSIVVAVRPQDAKLSVDGKIIETAPPNGELWLEPGTYKIQAKSDFGASESQTVVIRQGERTTMTLVGPTPPPTPAPAVQPSAIAPLAHAVPARSAPSDSGSSRPYVLIGGAALTAIAAGIGTTYWLLNRAAQTDANAASQSLAAQSSDRGSCATTTAPSACGDLNVSHDRMNETATIGEIAFVAAGVLGAATVGTYLLWPTKRDEQVQQGRVLVAPYWSPDRQGVSAKIAF